MHHVKLPRRSGKRVWPARRCKPCEQPLRLPSRTRTDGGESGRHARRHQVRVRRVALAQPCAQRFRDRAPSTASRSQPARAPSEWQHFLEPSGQSPRWLPELCAQRPHRRLKTAWIRLPPRNETSLRILRRPDAMSHGANCMPADRREGGARSALGGEPSWPHHDLASSGKSGSMKSIIVSWQHFGQPVRI